MKLFKLSISVILCAGLAFLCQQIISNSVALQESKQESAEINHIKYGLFSINKWKEQLAGIISDEIGKLNLTNANKRMLKKHVEVQLDGLIDNVDQKIRASNKGSTKGWLKQSFLNAFVDVKSIKEGIPGFADAIILEMTKSQTERHFKDIVKKRIERYFDKTFETQDLSRLNYILGKTGTLTIESARAKLSGIIETHQRLIYQQTWLLVGLALILFGLIGFSKKALPAPLYALLLFALVVLLLTGVTTPMIDMEAKISEMRFVLLDHPIVFVNQVLYFQSKSILDVFWIMFTHEDLQMKVVGILMVTFSIVFPILKMLSSVSYYYDFHKARENRGIQFFVLKSGKWSMTDVLVVAIFMAYIGFNGIISSQFGHMKSTDQEIVILTTNGTSLQPGFYIFLTYTLLALFLSGFLVRRPGGALSN
jgi:hypothetical protein